MTEWHYVNIGDRIALLYDISHETEDSDVYTCTADNLSMIYEKIKATVLLEIMEQG